MKTKIKVSYGRTVNLGDFEFARIDCEIAEELPENDSRSYEQIFSDLFAECEDFVLRRCEKESIK